MLYNFTIIPELEDFIIFDTSARPQLASYEDDICHLLYDLQSYRNLDLDLLEREIKRFEIFNDFINQPTTFTIPEVVLEMNRFAEIIENKKKGFEWRKNRFIKSKRSRRREKFQNNKSVHEETFNELHAEVLDACLGIQESCYSLNKSKAYEILEDIVYTISFKGKCKSLSRRIYTHNDNPEKIKEKKDLKTDEKIIATTLYNCLIKREPCAVISRDYDFINIFLALKNIFAKDMPNHNKLIEYFIRFPITLYNNGHHMFFTKKKSKNLVLDFPSKFRLNRDSAKNAETRDLIYEKLERLCATEEFCKNQ